MSVQFSSLSEHRTSSIIRAQNVQQSSVLKRSYSELERIIQTFRTMTLLRPFVLETRQNFVFTNEKQFPPSFCGRTKRLKLNAERLYSHKQAKSLFRNKQKINGKKIFEFKSSHDLVPVLVSSLHLLKDPTERRRSCQKSDCRQAHQCPMVSEALDWSEQSCPVLKFGSNVSKMCVSSKQFDQETCIHDSWILGPAG